MAGKRIILPLGTSILLLTGGQPGQGVQAGWDCQRITGTGEWVCTAPQASIQAAQQRSGTAEGEPGPEAGSIAGPDTESLPATGPKPESGPEPEVRSKPESKPEPETEPERDSEPEPAPVSQPESRPESQSRSEPEPEPEPEPAPVRAIAPDASTPAAEPAIDYSRIDEGLTWGYCGPRPSQLPPLPSQPLPGEDEPLLLSADSAELLRRDNLVLLEGGVEADRGTQHLESERLRYERGNSLAFASGGVLFRQPGLRLMGESAKLDLASRQAWMDNAQYRLLGSENARGSAQSVHVESRDLTHFQDVTFSTCPPDSNAWELQANRLDLDRQESRGVARHAKLRAAGIPIMYTPYLSFSLDNRRKSGFLTPSIGNSNRLGLDLQAPYYFNLAPDMDATLTPRYLSKRGLALDGEFRWLTAHEHGQFNGEIIPNDSEFERDAMRGGLSFQQSGHFGQRWATRVRVGLVSDDTYLEDFGPDLAVTSTRNLERRGDLYYFGDSFQALARVQNFQTVDRTIAPENRPYSRLPQLLLYHQRPLWYGLQFGLEAENTYFHHSHRVYGDRLALRPVLTAPLRLPYGHLIPRVSVHQADYWLTDQVAGLPDNPSSTIPTFSLDSGLVFERNTSWFGEAASQTLEPRLYYLYTPYRDQDELPVFDTAELDFTFDSLFRENRFSGHDRIGDANQLTLALTSRTLSEKSGYELLRASIGQILYFSDRRVQLGGGGEEESSSAVAAELAMRLSNHWSARGSLMWDPHQDEEPMRKTSVALHYRTPEHRLFNLAYRLNRNDRGDDTEYEDTDASFRWPVSRRWELVGRWLYSMRHDKTMDAFGGVEYSHCCWRVRALVRNYVINPQDDPQFSFMLQFELTGLGALGNRVDEFLERGVYGYEVE